MSPGVFSVRDRLLDDRNALLDLGTRNRLIHVPLRTKNIRAIEIVDERSAEVFRLLSDGKRFTFKPGRTRSAEEKLNPAGEITETESDEEGAIPQPLDDATDDRGVAKRHSDTQLQTRLTSEGLQKRLLDIWYDARTLEEEQGVNILYLGLGLLKWFEDDKSDVERLAPLLLLPVRLERTSAADRFHLTWRAEPPSPNLSLQAKMNAEFGLKIEDFGDEDDVDLEAYMAKVADTVSRKARWAVQADAMVLGFFSFAKFLMYRDLDPENWPAEGALDQHPTIRGLLQDGFEAHAPIVADDGNIDPVILPNAMHHVTDADSSQTVAIEEVARGRHLVIKGPPGTGKSQTITNIIAAAAAQGRKVLFVAEKMAALDVVHRRLRDAGLAPLALELHSNKVNKKAVLEELKRTKGLATRAQQSDTTIIQRLTDARDQLNMHASMMHVAHEPSTLTPFRLLGQLVRTRAASGKPGYSLVTPEVWSPLDLEKRRELLDEIVARLDADSMPHEHPWRGVQRDALDPSEMEALLTMLDNVSSDLAEALRMCAQAASAYGLERPEMFADLAGCLALLDAAVTLPNCDRKSLESSVWERLDDVAEVVERGEKFTRLKTAVDSAFSEGAWDASLNACRTIIAEKGRSIFRILSGEYGLYRNELRPAEFGWR